VSVDDRDQPRRRGSRQAYSTSAVCGEPNTLDPGQSHVFFYDHVDKISSFLDPSGEAPPSMNVDRADDDVLSLPSSYTRKSLYSPTAHPGRSFLQVYVALTESSWRRLTQASSLRSHSTNHFPRLSTISGYVLLQHCKCISIRLWAPTWGPTLHSLEPWL
jgi:hypothetical protein